MSSGNLGIIALCAVMKRPGEKVGRFEEYVRTTAQLETADNTAAMVEQMSSLLEINEEQLEVERQQLNVQEQIRGIASANLHIHKEQLIRAVQTVKRLDLTNHRLQELSNSLSEISGLLARHNALFQDSLNRLATESRELIDRGIGGYKNQWYQEARKDFQQAVEKDPYSPIAHYYLGKCFTQLDDKPHAIEAYHKCITFASSTHPLLACLAYCDLAAGALTENNFTAARELLSIAMQCREHHWAILALTSLECDLHVGEISADTRNAILKAFDDDNIDPLWFFHRLEFAVANIPIAGTDWEEKLKATLLQWNETAKQAAFNQHISHFYREVDDFVYVARRIRRAFMESAKGTFRALGEPLAELLDWAAGIGEVLIKKIQHFTREHHPLLPLHQVLQSWNVKLLDLCRLVTLLDSKTSIVSGRFVKKLNLGVLELPFQYEDDTILFETTTEEGDTLALSCYYAIFIRDNGVQHFAIPLHEYRFLRIDTYETRSGTKGVVVTDSRNHQLLVYGITAGFETETREDVYYIDLFCDAAELLARVHEVVQWFVAQNEVFFSWFWVLDLMTGRLHAHEPVAPIQPDGEFEVVGDNEEFEVVE